MFLKIYETTLAISKVLCRCTQLGWWSQECR